MARPQIGWHIDFCETQTCKTRQDEWMVVKVDKHAHAQTSLDLLKTRTTHEVEVVICLVALARIAGL